MTHIHKKKMIDSLVYRNMKTRMTQEEQEGTAQQKYHLIVFAQK